jgi:hypothetical protein
MNHDVRSSRNLQLSIQRCDTFDYILTFDYTHRKTAAMSSEMTIEIAESGGLEATQRRASRASTKRLGRLSRRDEVAEAKSSLKVWGLDPNSNKCHQLFWDNILDATRGFVNGTGQSILLANFKDTRVVLPPGDPVSAVRFICEREIDILANVCKNRRMEEVRDLLAELNPPLPFSFLHI